MSGRRRRILHAFSTFALGGPQARFAQLICNLPPDHEHLICAMDNRFDATARLPIGGAWRALPLTLVKGGGLRNVGRLRTELQREQPDMLITYNWGAIEWSAAAIGMRLGQVHVEDGFGPDEACAQLPRRIWMRRILLGMRGIDLVVPSSTLRRAARGWWVAPRRLHYIPNGVELEVARPVHSVVSGEPIVIGTVAALRREKNIGRLLRAFALARRRQPLRLLIVGDGSERSMLERLTHELGVAEHVEFAGHVDQPRTLLRRMDLFALSSDTEQLPLSMLEAMAEGIPVLATAVGDVPLALPRLAAEALSPPDDEEFTAALLRVLDHRAHWDAWARAGREHVAAHYGFGDMLKRWQAVFNGGPLLETVPDLGVAA